MGVWAAVAVALSPVGMPTFTSAFVIVTWLMIMAKGGVGALTAVPPDEATTPEDNLRRWRTSIAS
ncbi:MAG: urea transporter [Pseudonocardiaceae bacterium]